MQLIFEFLVEQLTLALNFVYAIHISAVAHLNIDTAGSYLEVDKSPLYQTLKNTFRSSRIRLFAVAGGFELLFLGNDLGFDRGWPSDDL